MPKATDDVQTAEVKVLDEERRRSQFVSTADVAQDRKEKDLAAQIMKNIYEKTDAEFTRSEVNLPEGPIKSVGEFEVSVIVHPEVQFVVKVSVLGEE